MNLVKFSGLNCFLAVAFNCIFRAIKYLKRGVFNEIKAVLRKSRRNWRLRGPALVELIDFP